MNTVSESFSNNQKPVIVRVKRKLEQSLLDAFWLEINEISTNRLTKVLMRYLKTVTESDIITNSFFESDHSFCRKRKFEEDRKFDKSAENARFEQIRRNKQVDDQKCRFYDVIRVVDDESKDHKKLSCYLPLLKEFVPSAAQEIEQEYVYDYYYANANEETDIITSKNQLLPLVKVEDGEEYAICDDESGYDFDDLDAEYYDMSYEDEEIPEIYVGRVIQGDEVDGYAEDGKEFEYIGLKKRKVCVP